MNNTLCALAPRFDVPYHAKIATLIRRSLICTLNSPIIVGEIFNVELINVGHSNCLVGLELMWVQDLMSSPDSQGVHFITRMSICECKKGVII